MPIQGDGFDPRQLNAPLWLKENLIKLDIDGDGIDQEEIEELLEFLAKMKKAQKNNSSELDYTHFPQKVKDVLAEWDGDASGSVSVSELVVAAEAQKRMEKETKFMKQMFYGAVIVIVLLTAMSFVMGFAAQETAKDFRPKKSSDSRRMLYQIPAYGEYPVEKNSYIDSLLRILADNNPEEMMDPPSDDDIGAGTLVDEQGTRIGAAQSFSKKLGTDMPDQIKDMSPLKLGNLAEIAFNTPGGYKPLKVSTAIKATGPKGPMTKVTANDGTMVNFYHKADGKTDMHVVTPGNFHYMTKHDDFSDSHVADMQMAAEEHTSGGCASAECTFGSPMMAVADMGMDPPIDTAPTPELMMYCDPMGQGCGPEAIEQFFMDSNLPVSEIWDDPMTTTGAPTRTVRRRNLAEARRLTETFMGQKDCNGDGKLDAEEWDLPICGSKMLTDAMVMEPNYKAMTEDAKKPAGMAKAYLKTTNKKFGKEINIKASVDVLANNPVYKPFLSDSFAKEEMVKKLSEGDPLTSGYMDPAKWQKSVASSVKIDPENLKNGAKPPKPQVNVQAKCKYFLNGKIKAVHSAAEMKMGKDDNMESMRATFSLLDKNHDGKVTEEECVGGDKKMENAFEAACGMDPEENCNGLLSEHHFTYIMEKNTNEPKAAKAYYKLADKDGDGHLTMSEYAGVGDGSMFENIGGKSSASRLLREIVVERPRRRVRQRRLAQKERRLRQTKKRKLGSVGEYAGWLNKRKLRAMEKVAPKRKQLRRLQEDMHRRRLDRMSPALKQKFADKKQMEEMRLLQGNNGTTTTTTTSGGSGTTTTTTSGGSGGTTTTTSGYGGGTTTTTSGYMASTTTYDPAGWYYPTTTYSYDSWEYMFMDEHMEEEKWEEEQFEYWNDEDDYAGWEDEWIYEMVDGMDADESWEDQKYMMDEFEYMLPMITGGCYGAPRVLLDKADQEWHHWGRRKLLGHHIRKLSGHECTDDGFPEDPYDYEKSMAIAEGMMYADPDTRYGMIERMKGSALDEGAQEAMYDSGPGFAATPAYSANMDSTTMCEVDGPMKGVHIQLRFLTKKARLLSEDGSVLEGEHRERRLAGLVKNGKNRRMLSAGAAPRALMDHCDFQITSGSEISKMGEMFGQDEYKMNEFIEYAHHEHEDMAAKMDTRIMRFLKENKIHPDDMAEYRRLDEDFGFGSWDDNNDVDFFGPCDTMYMMDPMGYDQLLHDPYNHAAYEYGDPGWCTSGTQHMYDEYLMYEEEPYPMEPMDPFMFMTSDQMFQTGEGHYHAEADITEEVTMGRFFEEKINDPNGPWDCQMLPESEKWLPVDENGYFMPKNSSNGLWTNMDASEKGPGCSMECSYLGPWDWCGCLDNKKWCHNDIIEEYTRKGGQIHPDDEFGEENMDYGVVRRRKLSRARRTTSGAIRKDKIRMRKLKAKAVHKDRMRNRRVRKLLNHDRRKLWEQNEMEKRRLRAMRNRIRRLARQEPDKKRRLQMVDAEARRLNYTDYYVNYTDPYAYDWAGADETFIYEPVCGDVEGEICPCSNSTGYSDEYCWNGFEYDHNTQMSMDLGYGNPHEHCHVAPDFSDMHEEMKSRRLRKQRRKLARKERRSLKKEKRQLREAGGTAEKHAEHKRKLSELNRRLDYFEMSYEDTYSMDQAFGDEGEYNFEYFTPELEDDMYDMFVGDENYVSYDFMEEVNEWTSYEWQPTDFKEAADLRGSVYYGSITRADYQQPHPMEAIVQSWNNDHWEDISDGECVSNIMIDSFVDNCMNPDAPTDPEMCYEAENVQWRFGLDQPDFQDSCLGEGDMNMYSEGDYTSMYMGNSDENGEVTIGQYQCLEGSMFGTPANTTGEDFFERSEGGGGLSYDMAFEASPSEQMKESAETPEEMKEKELNYELNRREEEHKVSCNNAHAGLEDMIYEESHKSTYEVLLRNLKQIAPDDAERRVLFSASEKKDGESSRRQLRESHGRKLGEVRDKFSKKLRALQMVSDHPGPMGIRDAFMGDAQEQNTFERFYDMIAPMYECQKEEFKKMEERKEYGAYNYSDPAVTETWEDQDDYDYKQTRIDETKDAMDLIWNEIDTLNTTRATDKGSGAFFGGGYSQPARTMGATEALKVADCMHGMMEEEKQGPYNKESSTDFDTYSSWADPMGEHDHYDMYDEYISYGESSGMPPDENGAFPKEAFEAPSNPFFEEEEKEYDAYYTGDDMISIGSKHRRMFVLTDIKINWRRLATQENVIAAWDEAGTIHTHDYGDPLENQNDAKILATGCLPWEQTLEDMAGSMAKKNAAGATAGQAKVANALQNIKATKEGKKKKKPMSATSEGKLGDSLKNIAAEKMGTCETDDCDQSKAAGAVPDKMFVKAAHKMDHDNNGCFPMNMPEAFSCEGFGDSQLSLTIDSDNDGLPDGGAITQLDYKDMCHKAKEDTKMKKSVEKLYTKVAERAATKFASEEAKTALRRMLRQGKGHNIHPHVRKLAGLRPDFRDNQGRRLDEMGPDFEYEAPMEDGKLDEYMDYFMDSEPTMEDANMLMDSGLYEYMNEDSKEIFETYTDAYEEDKHMNLYLYNDDETKMADDMADLLPEDYYDMYDATQEMMNYADTIADATDPVKTACKAILTPEDTSTYSATGDGDSDGIDDQYEMAYCMQNMMPDIPDFFEDDCNDMGHGSGDFSDHFDVMVPADEMKTQDDALNALPSKCYDECARDMVPGYNNNGTAWTLDTDCAGASAVNDVYGNAMSKCDMVDEYADPVYFSEKKNEMQYTLRRLAVEKRRLAIAERRRLEGENSALSSCYHIDGKEYCQNDYTETSRKLQQKMDELDAHGISYLIPAAKNLAKKTGRRHLAASTRRLKGRKRGGAGKSGRALRSRKNLKRTNKGRAKAKRSRRGKK